MKIKEKESSVESVKKTDSMQAEYLIFIALNVFMVPYSFYQTLMGYKISFDTLTAIALATISALLFLAMNFGIRSSRILGERHLLKVVMYLIPLAISWTGNFNAFYSSQTKSFMLRDEVTSYKTSLDQTYKIAKKKIKELHSTTEFEEKYSGELTRFTDDYEKFGGWGDNCFKYWVSLCKLIKKEGGTIDINRISKEPKDKKFDMALRLLEGQKVIIINSQEKQFTDDFSKIAIVFNDKEIIKIDSLNKKDVFEKNMFEPIVKVENEIRNITVPIIKKSEKDLFESKKLELPSVIEIGKIKHSLNSAFVKFENPSATFISASLALIIDFAALIYILVFIPYYKERKPKGTGRINSAGPRKI
jgi:hypothetical protein